MRNLLVTGGYGFIGSQVVNVALSDYEVDKLVVIDILDYCSREANVKFKHDPRFAFVKGDICNVDLVQEVLEHYNIDTVIHMAAQSHVDLSFVNPLQFTQDNILGTHNLLEACRKYNKIERFVYMSTDEVYGQVPHNEKVPCDENSSLNPTNPYSATKAAAELIVRSYGCSFKLPYIIIRGNNVYGKGQFPDKLISKFIMYLLMGRKVPIHGDGSSKRTFVHVSDMARGILTVAQKGRLNEIYNIGSDNEYSVIEIARILCTFLDKNFESFVSFTRDRQFNDKRYFINYNKILSLEWKEQISFHEGLKLTIDWYKKHFDEFKQKI
jgi:dTDP-D-glucose 4,6-dehydratase